jgi:hypothetical protein
MHDLEQAALDDPFLADAIEGLMHNATTPQDLDHLHQRLATKVANAGRRRKIIIIQRRIAIAAALILLLGIGYTFFNRHNDRFRSAPAPATVVRKAPAATTQPPITAKAFNRPPATATRRNVKSKSSLYKQLPQASAHPPQPPSQLPRSAPDQATSSGYLSPAADSLALAKAAANPLVYSGKVLDLYNHPLAGAFLAFNGNYASGAVTDEQGQFMISLHPRDSTRQLTVSMIGYDHESFAVNTLSVDDQKGNIIRLKPSTTNLDEVVVVGYGMHRKETEVSPPLKSDEKLDTLWTTAAPTIGRQAYLQYLGIAKKKLGLDSTITGPETVSFIVSRNGPLSSFKIEQSLSPAHDAGIIRLITDGPAWRLIRGRKARASVTVNF